MIRHPNLKYGSNGDVDPATLDETAKLVIESARLAFQDALDLANRTGTACWVYVDGKLTNIADSGKVAAKKATKKPARKVARPTSASRKSSATTTAKPARPSKPSAARKR